MPTESVLKIYDEEKKADNAEIEAKKREVEIIEAAKEKGKAYIADAISKARKEQEERLEMAKLQGESLSLKIADDAKAQMEKIEDRAKAKREDAVKAVMENLV